MTISIDRHDLFAWQKHHSLSYREAARIIGISGLFYTNIINGDEPLTESIARTVALYTLAKYIGNEYQRQFIKTFGKKPQGPLSNAIFAQVFSGRFLKNGIGIPKGPEPFQVDLSSLAKLRT
ncbi:hypothetical protein [Methylophaga pinxianii]|uniref:hypothetical protein n=1 Tax=Methylophaga pinxianii TaxID=2881052 RepID=UPI001CF4A394|nr:hypothetical protein [Methylophaga pinxianii]MCB2426427.1 hypothetical protein [Methylophaga pinxianii]UPH44998.1 hypothetical protein LGT42_010800 [Methylophaga pinxianii]